MLHKFSVFSMFLNWLLLDFASSACRVRRLQDDRRQLRESLALLMKWYLTVSLSYDSVVYLSTYCVPGLTEDR